jgi:CxxC motif-containing protein
VPVKTRTPCPKEKIPVLLADIYKTTITLPIKAGDTVIANWQNCGIDVVATRSVA